MNRRHVVGLLTIDDDNAIGVNDFSGYAKAGFKDGAGG